MSLSYTSDETFNSVTIRSGGLRITDNVTELPGSIRFNNTAKAFEGYTGEPGTSGEMWRSFMLDIASSTKLGGIKVGSNLTITPEGVLSSVAAGESRLFQHVITVSYILGVADFQTIQAAIDFINQQISDPPSSTTAYKIIVSPGLYQEKIIIPDYVSLQGEGSGVTIIRTETGGATPQLGSLIQMGESSRLEKIELQHYEGSLTAVCVYAEGKSNVVIDDVKIVMGETSYSAADDVYGLYFKNCTTPHINNVQINITYGTNVYGMYFDPTSPIVTNSQIDINSSGNNNYGIYNYDDSNGNFRSCVVNLSGGSNNVAMKNIDSAPYLNGCNLVATGSNAYGIINESTSFASILQNNSNVSFLSNLDQRGVITVPDSSIFREKSYIIISGASLSQNNSTFLIESIPSSTELVVAADLLVTESAGSSITIKQYYTVQIDFSFIQGSMSSLINTNPSGHYAILGEKSTFVGLTSSPTANNGLIFFQSYNLITVGNQGANFKKISDALNSIVDNSDNRRYVIIVQPGIYNESFQLVMKPYVNITGNGTKNTFVSFDISDLDDENSAALILNSNMNISDISFTNIQKTTISTPIPNTIRTGFYGSNCTNFNLKNVSILVSCENGSSEYMNGINFINCNDKITIDNINIKIDGGQNNIGIKVFGSSFDIRNSIILIDTTASTNYGILSEQSSFVMIGVELSAKGLSNTNIALNTTNSSTNNSLIQFFSCSFNGSDATNNYGIYTCDYQSIIGGNSNIFGTNYYNLDETYYSVLKLHSCWGTMLNNSGNVEYYMISSSGVPISTINGNLFVGDLAGNIGVSGGGNTAVGTQSGSFLTTADYSTFLGNYAGENTTSGDSNTFVGYKAGQENTTGTENTFTGYLAGQENVSGTKNVATGSNALYSGISSANNVAIGSQSGYSLINDDNTLVGTEAGYHSTTAIGTVMVGMKAGHSNISGSNNVYVGFESGSSSTTANNVVAVGHHSGKTNTVSNNVFVGTSAGYNNTSGLGQTIIGHNAGFSNTIGNNNTLLGSETGYSLQTGSNNLVAGSFAGRSLTTGSRNILLGSATTYSGTDSAGYSLINGEDVIAIGTNAGSSLTNGSKNIVIGTQAGRSLATGTANVLIGYQSGQSQTGQSGNILIGNQAGYNNNNAGGNLIMIGDNAGYNSNVSTSIFIGKDAGRNAIGSYNIGIGFESLKNQTTGGTSVGNVFVGPHSGLNVRNGSRSIGIGGGLSGSGGVLSSVTDQSDNTAIGYLAGNKVVSDQNTLIGSQAGFKTASGGLNNMYGYQSGYNNTTGQKNVYLGSQSGYTSTTGTENTFVGYQAGYSNNTQGKSVAIGSQAGYKNVAEGVVTIGYRAGYSNQQSPYNIFIGYESGGNTSKVLGTGSQANIFIGYQSGYNAEGNANSNIFIGSQSGVGLSTGDSNIMIGDGSGLNIGSGSKNIFIGPDSIGSSSTNVDNNIFIGSGAGKNNVSGTANIYVGSNAGQNALASNNICFGPDAGKLMTSGERNVYLGNQAGQNNITGQDNICIGNTAGGSNLSTTDFNNSILIGSEAGINNLSDNFVSIGSQSGLLNTTGSDNINIGYQAGRDNIIGASNINIGLQAGLKSKANNNIFLGSLAGSNNTSGENNVVIGGNAGISNIIGNSNIFIGSQSGQNSKTDNNISIGTQAGQYNQTGLRNIFFGFRAGQNSTNNDNIFFGNESGLNTTIGESNVFIGNQSGINTLSGNGNVFLGYKSGFQNITGNNSMFLGFEAGYNNQTGNDSLYLGYQAGYSNVSGNSNLAIGYRSQKLNNTGNQNIAIGNYSLFGNVFGDNNMVFGTHAASLGDIGNNNIIVGIESARIIKNPGFSDNIINGYRSNFQGFASKGSIVIGSNAIGQGIGGEYNLVMGINAGVNLGGAIQPLTITSGTSPNANQEGYNIIGIGSDQIKKGQYLSVIYNSSEYEPQIFYIISTNTTESIISGSLATSINLATDASYLLYGEKSSIIESANSGDSYIIVKTPKDDLDVIFMINDKIVIQSLNSTTSMSLFIVSIEVETGTSSTGTSRVNVDTTLPETFMEGDLIYYAHDTDNNIGPSDTSIASSNIIMGNQAASSLTLGSKNIVFGTNAFFNATTEKYNTVIGTEAGYNTRSDNNFLLGTKTGYYVDYAVQGNGENTMIGFATGQFAGATQEASNNLFIGNRVGQINQGSNNIFIGNELETMQSATATGNTNYSNKFAIYKSDAGVPSNPILGADLNNNKLGILTMDPKSSLEVNGSFAKTISTIIQFNTLIDYPESVPLPDNFGYPRVIDKKDTTFRIVDTPENYNTLTSINFKGIGLIDSEFVRYNNKFDNGSSDAGISELTRGLYLTSQKSHPDGSQFTNVGAIKNISQLSTDVPSTGIISIISPDIFDTKGIIVIDSEIIQYNGKNGGLGHATRGFNDSNSTQHTMSASVYSIDNTTTPPIKTLLALSISDSTTNIPMDPSGFPSSGNIIIDSEIIYYPDNTPYLLNITRNTNGTVAANHYQDNSVYLISDNTDPLNYSQLSSPGITGGSLTIGLNDLSQIVSIGYIIIGSEIIKYDNISFIDVIRGTNSTSATLHNNQSIVKLISDNTLDMTNNFLDQSIDENGLLGVINIPIDSIILADASGFPINGGTILIDTEIITYSSITGNILETVLRGQYGTIPAFHSYATKVYLVTNPTNIQGIVKTVQPSETFIDFIGGHANFPNQGTIQIDAELIKYNSIVLNTITRGVGPTPITNHSTGETSYNFETLIDTVVLNNDIDNITTLVGISSFQNFTTNGTILIDNELITYSQGAGIINVQRNQLNTIATSHIANVYIFNAPNLLSNYSTINYTIQSDETGLPILDNSLYPTTGIVLIDSELIAYENKKTLDNVIRGFSGSTASSHLSNANIYETINIKAIASLDDLLQSTDDTIVLDDVTDFTIPSGTVQVQTVFNDEIFTEIISYSQIGQSLVVDRGVNNSTPIIHNPSELVYKITDGLSSTTTQPLEITDSSVMVLDNTLFPTSGVLRIDKELILYNSKNKSLEVDQRGYRSSSINNHNIGSPVYNIYINTSIDLSYNLVNDSQIKYDDTAIPVPISIDGINASGDLLLGAEIINYTSKNNSLVLNNIYGRGLYASSPQSHDNLSNVYAITFGTIKTIETSIIYSDFIPITTTNTFSSSGDVKVDKEIIGYDYSDRTILSTSRSQYNSTPAVHAIGTNVYTISVLDSAIVSEPILMGSVNPPNNESDFIIVNDSSIFNETGGDALIYQNGMIGEVIHYGGKNKTYVGATRGLDQSVPGYHSVGDFFRDIDVITPNIELINNIDDTQTIIALNLYDSLNNPKVGSNGYIALDNELLEYTDIFNNIYLTNVNRGQSGTVASNYSVGEVVNQIEVLNVIAGLNASLKEDLSTTTTTFTYTENRYSLTFSLIRGTNLTSASSHSNIDNNINNNAYLLSYSNLPLQTGILNLTYGSTIYSGIDASENIIRISGNILLNTSDQYILIEQEIIKFDNFQYIAGTTGIYQLSNCIRGYAGTSRQYHANGVLVYKIDEPSPLFIKNINNTDTTGYIWPGDAKFNNIGDKGTLLVNNEIMTYTSSQFGTYRFINCQRNFDNNIYYPYNSLYELGNGVNSSIELISQTLLYGDGVYNVSASSMLTDHPPSMAFNNYDDITNLTSTVSDIEITSINVISTIGFKSSGYLLIEDELISYSSKNNTQFLTLGRGLTTPAVIHNTNKKVQHVIINPSITDNPTVTSDIPSIINMSINQILSPYFFPFDAFPASGYVKIYDEIFSFASRDTYNLYGIIRGCFGTTSIIGNGPTNVNISLIDWVYNNPLSDNSSSYEFGWKSDSSKYNSTTGEYIGSSSTNIDGTNYNGEWIKIQLPSDLSITAKSLFINKTFNGRSKDIVIGASSDGVSWFKIYEDILMNEVTPSDNTIDLTQTIVPCSYFVYVVKSIWPDNSTTYSGVNKIKIIPIGTFNQQMGIIGTPISTKAQLQAINDNISTLSGHYYLINDIDMSDSITPGWVPIGDTNNFTGILDGCGYTIYNLTSTTTHGLIRNGSGCVIKNINISNFNITFTSVSSTNLGCLVGYVINSKIIKCNVVSSTITDGKNNTGLLVGYSESSSIKVCSAIGIITVYTGSSNIGGLVGYIKSSSTIEKCYTNIQISYTNSTDIGGLLGKLEDSLINMCYSSGLLTYISGTCSNIGGMIGYSYASLTNSYSIMQIVAGTATNIGGLIGYQNNNQSSGGGLYGSIVNCFSSTTITGGFNIGGLIGIANYTIGYFDLTSSYFNNSILSANTDSGSLLPSTGKTTTELQTESTFINWNFFSIWSLDSEKYPTLQGIIRQYIKSTQTNYIKSITLNEDLNVDLFKTKLVGDFSATDTEIAVLSTTGFTNAGYILINNEIISYSSKTSIALKGLNKINENMFATIKSGSAIYFFAVSLQRFFYCKYSDTTSTNIDFNYQYRNNPNPSGGYHALLNSSYLEIVKTELTPSGNNLYTHDPNAQFACDAEIMSATKVIQTSTHIPTRISSADFYNDSNVWKIITKDLNGYMYCARTTGSSTIIKIPFGIAPPYGSISDPVGIDHIIQTGVIDNTGTYGYFASGSNTTDVKIIKVTLSSMAVASTLTIVGTFNFVSSVIDPTSQYAYFGTDETPGNIYKINLSTLTTSSILSVGTNNNNLTSAIISSDGLYAYFGTNTSTYTYNGILIKIDLTSFTVASSLSLGINNNNITCAVIDNNNKYAYLGTNTSPARIIKVDVTTSPMTVVSKLIMDIITTKISDLVNSFSSAIIDTNSIYAYFSTSGDPGQIVKFNLETFSIDDIVSKSGYSYNSCMIDDSNNYIYLATSQSEITKVDLNYSPINDSCYLGGNALETNVFEYETSITLPTMTISVDANIVSSVIDSNGEYGYFGTDTNPGYIIKFNLKTFEVVSSISTGAGNGYLRSGIISKDNQYAYFGTYTSTCKFVRINLSDFTTITILSTPDVNNFSSATISTDGLYGYFATNNTGGTDYIYRLDLSNFLTTVKYTVTGSTKITACVAAADTYVYFVTGETPGKIIKVDEANTSQTLLTPEVSGNTGFYSIAINSDSTIAYLGASVSGTNSERIIRVKLSDFTYLDTITISNSPCVDARLSSLFCDASGMIYASTYGITGGGVLNHRNRITQIKSDSIVAGSSLVLNQVYLPSPTVVQTGIYNSSDNCLYYPTNQVNPTIHKIRIGTTRKIGDSGMELAKMKFKFSNSLASVYTNKTITRTVIDPTGKYLYSFAYIDSNNGVIEKINILNNTSDANVSIPLNNDTNATCKIILIDSTGTYIYAVIYKESPAEGAIMKFNASDLTQVGSTTIISSGYKLTCGAITPDDTYAMIGSNENPGKIYKIKLSDLTQNGSTLTLGALGTGYSLKNVFIEPTNTYAFFVNNSTDITANTSTIIKILIEYDGLTPIFDNTLTPSVDIRNINSVVYDNTTNYAYLGGMYTTGQYVIIKLYIETYNFTYVDALTTGYYNYGPDESYLDQPAIISPGKFAYFTTLIGDSNVGAFSMSYKPPTSVLKINLVSFTTEGFLHHPSPSVRLPSFVKNPITDSAYLITNESTRRMTCIGLNENYNSTGLKNFSSPIEINPIKSESGLLFTSQITLLNESDFNLFSRQGGDILFVKYSSSSIDVNRIITYVAFTGYYISEQEIYLSNVNTNTQDLVFFDKIIILNNFTNAPEQSPYFIGTNQIDDLYKDNIPIGGGIFSISNNGTIANNYYVTGDVKCTNIQRALRNTLIQNHVTSSKIIRVNSTQQSSLFASVSSIDINIPIINASTFNISGVFLIGSEIISYESGYGYTITRGSLNTIPSSHLAATHYYNYELFGTYTTLRSNIEPDSINIPLTDTMFNIGQFLITSGSAPGNPEFVNNGLFTKSIDIIYKGQYGTNNAGYPSITNLLLYKLNDVSAPAKLRNGIDDVSSSVYISLDNDASTYASQFNNQNYVLIDQEFFEINSRNSLDILTRNKYSTGNAAITTVVQEITVSLYSQLRQQITANHLFIPLISGVNYPDLGVVVIDQEWIQYDSKNSFDFDISNRGQYNTTSFNYAYNVNIPLLILNPIISYANLRSSINTTTKILPLDADNSSYNLNDIILVGGEFLLVNNKYSFDDITRQYLNSGLYSSITSGIEIFLVNIENISSLRSLISAIAKYIPLQFGDSILFNIGDIGFVNGEFFSCNSKNTLDGLLHGIPSINHEINTGLNVVTEICPYIEDGFGNIILDSFTIQGDKVLLSDAVSGIRVISDINVADFPPSGIITIGNEKILYESNKTIADLTRGSNNTIATTHVNDTFIYLIGIDINTPLINSTLANDIYINSSQINLSSVIGFSSTGIIIIDSEIIIYSGIQGNTLNGCLRGRYATIPSNHTSSKTVYLIQINNIIRTFINQDVKIDDLIISLDDVSSYPENGGIVLIDSEIIIYRSKNALGKLTRGFDLTEPLGYINLSPQTFTNILLTDLDNTVIINTTTGDVRVDLPSAIDIKGRIYTVKKISSINILTILANGTETIDGDSSIVLTLNNSYVSIQSDGANWLIILDKYDISFNTTDDLVEGTTNLYYRDDRVIALTGPLYDPINSATDALNSAKNYTDNAIADIKDNPPIGLDTLGNIASAINNDVDYSTTVTNQLSLKLNITDALATYLTQTDAQNTYAPIGLNYSYLNDVAIASPMDGDIVRYDSSSSTWVNRKPDYMSLNLYGSLNNTFFTTNAQVPIMILTSDYWNPTIPDPVSNTQGSYVTNNIISFDGATGKISGLQLTKIYSITVNCNLNCIGLNNVSNVTTYTLSMKDASLSWGGPTWGLDMAPIRQIRQSQGINLGTTCMTMNEIVTGYTTVSLTLATSTNQYIVNGTTYDCNISILVKEL